MGKSVIRPEQIQLPKYPKWVGAPAYVKDSKDSPTPVVDPETSKNDYVGTKKRVFVIDTGSSNNTLKERVAQRTISEFVRSTKFELEFDTANDTAKTSEGARVQIGYWTTPSDFVLMKHSPELLSVGEHCTFQGFSFFWIYEKQPCFVSYGGKYIIIFEVDA